MWEIRTDQDIIISGGGTFPAWRWRTCSIATPMWEEAAVIAMPDETWGGALHAYVKLKEGGELSHAELIAFCREQMAHFKAPSGIIFTPLPKTSTGKVQNSCCASSWRDDKAPRHQRAQAPFCVGDDAEAGPRR